MSRWDAGAATAAIHSFKNPGHYYNHWTSLVQLDEKAYIAMIESMNGVAQLAKLDDGVFLLSCSDPSKFHAATMNQLVDFEGADGELFQAHVVRYYTG